jgi:hypothetical protein
VYDRDKLLLVSKQATPTGVMTVAAAGAAAVIAAADAQAGDTNINLQVDRLNAAFADVITIG